MRLIILRVAFILAAAGIATLLIGMLHDNKQAPTDSWLPWSIFFGTMAVAGAVIALDIYVPKKPIDVVSSVYVGILVGVLLTYIMTIALEPMLPAGIAEIYRTMFRLLVGMSMCYVCTSLLMQTKDDFRFIIPYVEFAKEIKGVRPYILDTSVIIDGRIADLVETNIIDTQLLVPRFVLGELQGIADSNDKLRRARGRRGLDIVNRLRGMPRVDLKIHDQEFPEMAGQPVDMKLVLLAKHLEGKIITGDFNLNKVAKIHNVAVLNLNDIANALKPVFLPGENLEVRIVKPGEEQGQGVGYLDDGTMIVVEGGREHLGKAVGIAVTSVLQTSAGRMIFGRAQQHAQHAS
jgi:uncharacterized protein YacL